MYVKSMQMSNQAGYSQYSTYFAGGFGSGWSDLDMDHKLGVCKLQAFNTFSKAKRFFMSPAHNYYLNLNQQQQTGFVRAKSLTGFGPAAHEERFLKDNLLSTLLTNGHTDLTRNHRKLTLSQFRQLQFYAPLFILAPGTITTQAINLLASNLFFKNAAASNPAEANSKALSTVINGECSQAMPNFIQLNMSNSHYGYLNLNLNEVIHNQQQLMTVSGGVAGGSAASASNGGSGVGGAGGSGSGVGTSSSGSGTNISGGASAATSSLMTTTYQQQCNVLYVSYCLSEDQRFFF